MDFQITLRQLLRAPQAYRTFLTVPPRPQLHIQTRSFALLSPIPHPRHLSVPRLLQPHFWASVIPRALRERPSFLSSKRGWNPATSYIVLGLLVGSQAIQILWLKQEWAHEMRKAEAKIGKLREVIERVHKGENVDVEAVLGTGVPGEEEEWAEVMRELENEELLYGTKNMRKKAAAVVEDVAPPKEGAVEERAEAKEDGPVEEAKVKVETIDGAKFF